MMKWIFIGFLGTMSLVCLGFVFVICHFRPFVSVNDKTDHIVVLDGLIDVDSRAGQVKIGHYELMNTLDEFEQNHPTFSKKTRIR